MSGNLYKSNIIGAIIIVLLTIMGHRFLLPLLTRKVYEARIDFKVTGEINYKAQNYYTGGTIIGNFHLKEGQNLRIEIVETPAGSSNLHYNNLFLMEQKTGEIVDITKLTITNPSELTGTSEGTYSLSLCVTKSILYDPEKSQGLWVFKIVKAQS